MIYADEEARDTFHKASTLMQMVTGMFESFSMHHGKEPELIGVVLEEDTALFRVAGLASEQAFDICDQLNAQFGRSDEQPTCRYIDDEHDIFELYVTKSKDFCGTN